MIPEWLLLTAISAHAVRVYARLATFADQHGRCYVLRERLARDTRMSRSSVARALRELVRHGAVTITPRTTDHDGRREKISSVFTLAWFVERQGVVSPVTLGSVTRDPTLVSPVTHRTRSLLTRQEHKPTLRVETEQTEHRAGCIGEDLSITAAWIISQAAELLPTSRTTIAPSVVKTIKGKLCRCGVDFDTDTIVNALPNAISVWHEAVLRDERHAAKAQAYRIATMVSA